MKKKGFTLIELMAVIIILSFLALILFPLVGKLIYSAQRATFRELVSNLIDITYNFQSEYVYMNDETIVYPMTIVCDGTKCSDPYGSKLNFKGKIPTSGRIIIDSAASIRADLLSDGRWCSSGIKGNIEVFEDCYKLDHTPPVIDTEKEGGISISTTTNKVTVTLPQNLMYDDETGIVGYKVAIYLNGYKVDEQDYDGHFTLFTNLKNGTEYNVIITATNGNEGTTSIERTATTKDITNPTITYTNNPNETRDYYLSQVLNVDYVGTNIENPVYYIRSTRDGVANNNVVGSCGEENLPNECTEATGTNLSTGVWYRVSGDINVTYNVDSNTTGTLTALTYDGVNYSGASSKTIAKIENTNPTAPVIAGGNDNWTTTYRTISVATAGTASSGIAKYQYYISTSNSSQSGGSWQDVSGNSVNISTPGTHYVYFRTVSTGNYMSSASNSQLVKVDSTNYTISYTMNNGSLPSGVTNPTSYTVESSFTLNNPSRTGYTFVGWSGTGLTGNSNKNVSVGINNSGNRSYTANWTANTYTVTFDKQSGSNGSNSVTATYDSAMPSATAPTRSGYSFGGYYTSTNGGGTQYYNGSMGSARNWNIASATTLYAKWSACGAGTYLNGNTCTACPKNQYSTGGANASCTGCPTGYGTSGTGSNAKSACTITCSANTRVASADAQCSGCGTGYSIASHTVSAGSTSSACSANTFTVKYNCNGGGGSTAQHNCRYDGNCTAASNGCTNPSGKKFVGWKRENTGSIVAVGASIKNTVASGTVTYYAQWEGCGAGTYLSNSTTCTACPANTYSTGSANASCTGCPTGYSTNGGTGKTAKSACTITCGANSRVASTDAQCSSCGSGYVIGSHSVSAGSTSSACSACGAGKYAASGSCGTCPANTYSTGSANASCTNCPTGYGTGGGTGKTAKSACYITCAANTRVASTDAQCSSCGSGYYLDSHTIYAGNTSSACSLIVATAGGVNYSSLQAAINGAGTNVITLQRNTTENVTTSGTKYINLNGYTLYGALTNTGYLEINPSGTGGGTISSTNAYAINNSGSNAIIKLRGSTSYTSNVTAVGNFGKELYVWDNVTITGGSNGIDCGSYTDINTSGSIRIFGTNGRGIYVASSWTGCSIKISLPANGNNYVKGSYDGIGTECKSSRINIYGRVNGVGSPVYSDGTGWGIWAPNGFSKDVGSSYYSSAVIWGTKSGAAGACWDNNQGGCG